MLRAVTHILFVCIFSTLIISPAWAQSETVLFSFDNSHGGWPLSNLIYDSASDAFYGTTAIGGERNSGTVFKLKQTDPDHWEETVLYSFQGGTDAWDPDYGLLAVYTNGSISKLYGTCAYGGQFNYGAVFELTLQPDGRWSEAVIYSFASPQDGANPAGGLVRNKHGVLYGTTNIGGPSLGGTVFSLKHTKLGWKKHVLYSFDSGSFPEGHLLLDKTGALYGTTASGGPTFSGTVFQLLPPKPGRRKWRYKLLYTFTGKQGTDGDDPRGELIPDANGSLYGTTESGGDAGQGTVFRLDPPAPGESNWTETQLHRFHGGADGAAPVAGLIFDKQGALYGTTTAQGDFFGGTVFKLTPRDGRPWRKKTLWSFGGSGDGSGPWAPVLLQSGDLYGTTQGGGAFSEGTVFRVIR